MRVGGQTLARVATLANSHQLSSSFDRVLKNNAIKRGHLIIIIPLSVIFRLGLIQQFQLVNV